MKVCVECETCCYHWKDDNDDFPCCHWESRCPGDCAPCEEEYEEEENLDEYGY